LSGEPANSNLTSPVVIHNNYLLQAATNFSTCTPISTAMALTNLFNPYAAQAANFPHHFHRVLQQ
jgi:hypothetical protein